jgi:hypothetical protein
MYDKDILGGLNSERDHLIQQLAREIAEIDLILVSAEDIIIFDPKAEELILGIVSEKEEILTKIDKLRELGR